MNNSPEKIGKAIFQFSYMICLDNVALRSLWSTNSKGCKLMRTVFGRDGLI